MNWIGYGMQQKGTGMKSSHHYGITKQTFGGIMGRKAYSKQFKKDAVNWFFAKMSG